MREGAGLRARAGRLSTGPFHPNPAPRVERQEPVLTIKMTHSSLVRNSVPVNSCPLQVPSTGHERVPLSICTHTAATP